MQHVPEIIHMQVHLHRQRPLLSNKINGLCFDRTMIHLVTLLECAELISAKITETTYLSGYFKLRVHIIVYKTV